MSDNVVHKDPIGLFDHHLRYLSESYLSFFQERAKIEEQYAEALVRLHAKSKTIDTYLDEHVERGTVRQTWNEVRDNLEREAQTRQAFLSSLVVDVINPLSTLKETQDRTRNRIKEDIKHSSNAYTDYVEGTLSRLKNSYLKKCQEVQDHKASQAPPGFTHVPEVTPLATSRSNPGPSVPPVVTSPQPLRPLGRRASGHQPQPTHRDRSPSTSTAFQDLALHGKKQFNQLKTYLDNKGGTVKDGLGVRGDSAIKSVKAKREAEEADKEYRKGVHFCETLRLRRMKILENAYNSLELFVQESAETVKSVLGKYADNAITTANIQIHLASHARSTVDQISPQQDIRPLAAAIPRFIQQATPRRILYHNFTVGECNDLIFGVSLVDYATARGLKEGEVPKVIRICIDEVERRGLGSEGIYRVPGRHAIVRDLMYKMEKDEAIFQFAPTDDIFVVASLLKQYLRELPEPVFKFPLEDRVKHSEEINKHVANNFLFIRGKIRRLPPVHQATLKLILEHLSLIVTQVERNKMDAKNLAIIFGAIVFGEDDMPKNGDLLTLQSWKDTLMEDLIVHAASILDNRPLPTLPSPMPGIASSPPLPPVPSGEPLTPYAYGSAYTQVSTLQPIQRVLESESPRSAEDFTPRMPPRPGNSIHPSRRTNVSGSSNRTVMPVLEEGRIPSDISPHSPHYADADTITTKRMLDPGLGVRDSVMTVDSFVSAQSSTPSTPRSVTMTIPEIEEDVNS